jgi:hypothetical protein
MKPHIKRQPGYRKTPPAWVCYGGGAGAVGATLGEAYGKWKQRLAMLASWSRS